MDATVYTYGNGTVTRIRPVKNLGWLMRHSQDVERIYAVVTPEGRNVLVADLLSRRFLCDFADPTILHDFVSRRRFAHATPRSQSWIPYRQ